MAAVFESLKGCQAKEGGELFPVFQRTDPEPIKSRRRYVAPTREKAV